MQELQDTLHIEQINALLQDTIELSDDQKERITFCRNYLDKKATTGEVFYGINTGFGSLCNVVVQPEEIGDLQTNLVLSHACGVGELVPDEIVRIMLLLKIKNFTYGHSGVSMELVERLLWHYNQNVLPEVFQQGSLGASGDLAPLAHLSLPLLGSGKVKTMDGSWQKSALVLNEKKLDPLELKSKEGLALLNGTQFMSAYGVWALQHMQKIISHSTKIATLSFEAFDCKPSPFYAGIHAVRPHDGQLKIALAFRKLLEGSQSAFAEKKQVQDPYSFRCIPQVHGASFDAFAQAKKVIECEINSVTDNPLIFPDEDEIVSGGNFHGQPLALQLDYLAIALSELANISERRTYLLVSGQRELPPFLSKNPGLESGFMIAQYTAASLVSQNKQLCTPASVDSIVSSNGQEDHVSMGANAATKLYQVVKNTERVLAIELLCAAQAIDFKNPDLLSIGMKKYYDDFRKEVSFMEKDRIISSDIEKATDFIV
jgi:histidine ammonia-lyase